MRPDAFHEFKRHDGNDNWASHAVINYKKTLNIQMETIEKSK